jgi:hypothetical protein
MGVYMNTDTYHQQQICSLSYHAAQRVVWQLREVAKQEGFNERDIKMRFTPQRDHKKTGAMIRVIWANGPDDWAHHVSVYQTRGVHVEAHEAQILSFYDV